jgi:hypothetical protein
VEGMAPCCDSPVWCSVAPVRRAHGAVLLCPVLVPCGEHGAVLLPPWCGAVTPRVFVPFVVPQLPFVMTAPSCCSLGWRSVEAGHGAAL